MDAPLAGTPDLKRLTDELRESRSGQRDPGADMVPVKDGEPMPAEEQQAERPQPCP